MYVSVLKQLQTYMFNSLDIQTLQLSVLLGTTGWSKNGIPVLFLR